VWGEEQKWEILLCKSGTVRSNILYNIQHAIILRKKDNTGASMFSLRMATIIGQKHVGDLTM
jgi:hypothetical protein